MNDHDDSVTKIRALLRREKIQVINLGLERFADTFEDLHMEYVQVNWQPPAAGDPGLSDMLAALQGK